MDFSIIKEFSLAVNPMVTIGVGLWLSQYIKNKMLEHCLNCKNFERKDPK